MNIILIVTPTIIYICTAIIALAALIQIAMLLLQHHHATQLDQRIQALLENIDQLTRH